MQIFGEIEINLKFNGMLFAWRFLVSNVKRNLIGYDLLKAYYLSLEFREKKLHKIKNEPHQEPTVKTEINWNYVTKQLEESTAPEEVKQLLLEYPKLIDEPIFTHTSKFTSVMKVDLTDDEPVVCRVREPPHAHLEAIDSMVANMIKTGIIEQTHSTYRSPGFLVKKANGKFRLVID